MISLTTSGLPPTPRQYLRSSILGTALLLGFAPMASAATGENSPVAGYLDIKAYGSSVTTGTDWTDPSPDATKATANTQALQAGLDYAYAHSLVAYLPLGTYQINDTLKCDSVGINGNDPVKAPHHELVGEVNPNDATARPLIKIAASATAWDSVTPVEGSVPPKPIIRFRHDQQASDGHGGGVADGLYDSNQNFYSMLRGVNFDTSTKGGAAGVQMDAAQNSSIENVKVTATSSYAGFYGVPSRSWGGINLEVEGGKYGIYHVAEGDSTTIPTATGIGGNAGSTIAGAALKNQTSSAIRFKGAGPLTIAGLEVVTPSGHSAINIPDGTDTYGATLVLLDGKITMSNTNDTAILNSNGRNLYLREIWVTGTDKLVKSGSNATITQTGTWKKLTAYSFPKVTGDSSADGFDSWNLINGTSSQTEQSNTASGGTPPSDLLTRHVPHIPSVNDTKYIPQPSDNLPTDGVSDARSALQAIIDNHLTTRIYLPPGTYKIGSPGLVLRSSTSLFGAGRALTRLEPLASWDPTSVSKGTVVTTDSNSTATTYLGDLSIGVDVEVLQNSWFTGLEWKAGKDSAVHIGQIYAYPNLDSTVAANTTGKAVDEIRITGNGGGRWYFPGHTERARNNDANFRQLRIQDTTQALSIYGLNLEHSRGDTFAEVNNADNVRVYGMKTEYTFESLSEANPETNPLITINNGSTNIAVYGLGAIRGGPGTNLGCIQVKDSATDGILAAGIAPQAATSLTAGSAGWTLFDFTIGGSGAGIDFPKAVTQYKKTTSVSIDDSAMAHGLPSY